MTILKGNWRCEFLCELSWFLTGAVHLHTLSINTSVGCIRSWLQRPPFGSCPHTSSLPLWLSGLGSRCRQGQAGSLSRNSVENICWEEGPWGCTSAAPQAKCTKSKAVPLTGTRPREHSCPDTAVGRLVKWDGKKNPFQCQSASQPNRVWHSVLPKPLSQQEKNLYFPLGLSMRLASSAGSSVNGKCFPLEQRLQRQLHEGADGLLSVLNTCDNSGVIDLKIGLRKHKWKKSRERLHWLKHTYYRYVHKTVHKSEQVTW